MKHLTFEEMADFVSFQTFDEKTVALMQKVTGHICRCGECREKLKAMQTLSDGYSDMCKPARTTAQTGKSGGDNAAPAKKQAFINSKTKENTAQAEIIKRRQQNG